MGDKNSKPDSVLDNIEFHKDFAIVSVNPKLYPLSVIYSAAYWILDRAHVIIDGDPDTEVLVEIRKKKGKEVELKKLSYEFNDELINYSVYTVQATRNKDIRDMVVQNSLNGNMKGPSRSQNPQMNNVQSEPCPTGLNQKDDDLFRPDMDEENISQINKYRDRPEDFKRG